MATIPLTQGNFAIVDDCDADLSQYRWQFHCEGRVQYAIRNASRLLRTHQVIRMHRVILERMHGSVPEGMLCDHINGNGLDNRRSNLRLVTKQQNQCNQPKKSHGVTSPFKGVCWDKNRGKWAVQINLHGKKIYIGRFDNEIEAAHEYDRVARELHGEYARLNFPDSA